MEANPAQKPFFRGRFHEAAAFVSLGASLMLITKCHDNVARGAVIVYSLTLVALFTCSALYHRLNWKPRTRALMRRLDHAAIFGLIGGTMTPVFLLALPGQISHVPLLLVWLVIAAGVMRTLLWIRAPKKLAVLIYIGVGWIPLLYLSELGRALGTGGVILILAGGLVYSAGAIIYATKRPNPWPRIFGYHEVFHICVVIAAVLHFIAINDLLARLPGS